VSERHSPLRISQASVRACVRVSRSTCGYCLTGSLTLAAGCAREVVRQSGGHRGGPDLRSPAGPRQRSRRRRVQVRMSADRCIGRPVSARSNVSEGSERAHWRRSILTRAWDRPATGDDSTPCRSATSFPVRVPSRLMNLNCHFDQRVVLFARDASWSPSSAPGVERRMLDRSSRANSKGGQGTNGTITDSARLRESPGRQRQAAPDAPFPQGGSGNSGRIRYHRNRPRRARSGLNQEMHLG